MNDQVIIITLNYNQNQYTLDCIQSILKSDYTEYKILLIDNGSTAENVNDLESSLPEDHRIIFKKIATNRGYVGGINYGLERVKKFQPEYIMIMNNDTLIDPEAISELVKTCRENNNKAIVTGKVYYLDEPGIIQTTGTKLTRPHLLLGHFVGHNEKDEGQYDEVVEREIIDDVFWIMPAKITDEIGLYSEWFGLGYEQAEYAMRAKSAGYKLVYTYRAKIWHKGNASVGHNIRTPYKDFWNINGYLIFRWLFLKKKWFLYIYITTWGAVIKHILEDLLLPFKKNKIKKNGFIQLTAILRFHVWLVFRINKDQLVPKSLRV